MGNKKHFIYGLLGLAFFAVLIHFQNCSVGSSSGTGLVLGAKNSSSASSGTTSGSLGVYLNLGNVSTNVGQSLTFLPIASGGMAPYSYAWSLVGGVATSCSAGQNSCTVNYPSAVNGAQVTVTVSDFTGAVASSTSYVTVNAVGANAPCNTQSGFAITCNTTGCPFGGISSHGSGSYTFTLSAAAGHGQVVTVDETNTTLNSTDYYDIVRMTGTSAVCNNGTWQLNVMGTCSLSRSVTYCRGISL